MAISNQISNYGSFKYVVTSTEPGPFHTIQSAINQAHTDGATTTIFVRPGTYTENLTLYDGINIQGSQEGQTIIVGLHTPPASGSFSISNAKLTSGTHVFSSAAAGTTNISVSNCIFNLTAGYVFNLASWTGDLSIDNCTDSSVANAIITNTTSAALDIKDSAIGAGATTLAASGVTRIFNARIFCPVTFSSTADVLIDGGSRIDAALTTANTATVSIYDTVISSGASTAVTHNSTNLLTLSNVTIDSTAATVIAGTGTVSLGEVVYPNSNTVIGTIVYNNDSELQCSKLIANDGALVTTGDVTIGSGKLYLGVSSGTNGQIPIAATGASPAWASITSTGGTIAITAGANTLNIETTGSADWHEATASMNLVAGNGYITKIAVPGLLTYTLPATAIQGSIIEITGYTAGGWSIAQNAGQSIHYAGSTTTVGVGGSLSSTAQYDSVRLVCVTADTEWNVIACIGNLTIV